MVPICSAQGSASGYEVQPSYRNDSGEYPLIKFCPSFWNMETLAQRVEQVEAGGFGFDKKDVGSLVCQGSAFLHEMFHTSATASGVSSPRCQDVKVNGYPGKAYGPARVKQLARMDLGGPGVTSINVDNYVFYSISWYMYTKWNIIPRLPKYSWPRLSAEEAYPDDSASDDNDDDSDSIVTIESGPVLDDADLYSGSGYTPSGGNQPAGPTGPSSDTETIPMATAAAPEPASSTVAPPASSVVVSPPPPPAYATGTCSFHVDEYQDCQDDSKSLFAIITMYDNAKTVIGTTSVAEGSLGASISTAYSFTSKLANPMVVIGEHENDYIQFTIGALSFTSRTKSGSATCNNGGWDPRDGLICGSRAGNLNAKNQVDCSFPC